jgi:hypothetical protein
MAVGDILKEANLVVEHFTVKANEDIEKGEVVVNDGSGILAAPNTVEGPFMVAMVAHDYSEETDHSIPCVVKGFVEVQKVSGSGASKKGQWVEISATAGEVTVFDYTTPGTPNDVVGTTMEDNVDADTSAKIYVGL